jgi:hypothetical protein
MSTGNSAPAGRRGLVSRSGEDATAQPAGPGTADVDSDQGEGHQGRCRARGGRLRSAAGSSKNERGESVVACSGVQVTTDPLICGVGDHARGFMASDVFTTVGDFNRRHHALQRPV